MAGIAALRAEDEASTLAKVHTVIVIHAEPAPGSKELLSEKFTPVQLAAALLAETNRVRVAHHRRPLKPLAPLAQAADDQAAFLAVEGESSHYSPLPGQHTAADRVRQHGLWDASIGENVLAMTLPASETPPTCEAIATELVEQWMNSPGHRENLLNRDFTHFGGSVRFAKGIGATERSYAVQVFAKPSADLK